MSEELKYRTKDFARCCIDLALALPEDDLYSDGNEILSIVVASIKTARQRGTRSEEYER